MSNDHPPPRCPLSRLEPLAEAQPPARIAKLPAELALRLCVRRSAHLRHHDLVPLARDQPAEPAGDSARLLYSDHLRQLRDYHAGGRGLIVDHVVDARPASLYRGGGRRGGVLDVDEGPDSAAVADDR